MDNLRAMREARYASATARAPKQKAAPVPREPAGQPAEQLCGHRNMAGRTCTREHGHAAKSHRYS
ncbi:MAG TPA: hypothetical protein VFG72_08440 [Marmoricola sp.]|nr:hypothetical protein [Marmoricola sp.]